LLGCQSSAFSGKRAARELLIETFCPAQQGQLLLFLPASDEGVACHS
jgi:hypothetical protein